MHHTMKILGWRSAELNGLISLVYEHTTHPLLLTSTGVIPSILTTQHGRRTPQPSTCANRRPYIIQPANKDTALLIL
jgi:hypothetical protein